MSSSSQLPASTASQTTSPCCSSRASSARRRRDGPIGSSSIPMCFPLAPPSLNRAGLGDLMATFTAPADWLLASFVGQDASYSAAIVALARSHVDALLEAAPGVRAGDPAALETLAATLTLSGISMGVAGRTSPGSGMEHTVSHLLEMAQARRRCRTAPWGEGRCAEHPGSAPVGARARGRPLGRARDASLSVAAGNGGPRP